MYQMYYRRVAFQEKSRTFFIGALYVAGIVFLAGVALFFQSAGRTLQEEKSGSADIRMEKDVTWKEAAENTVPDTKSRTGFSFGSAYVSESPPPYAFPDVGLPMEEALVTAVFGSRDNPVADYQEEHRGLDLAGKEGSAVFAAADGVVERISTVKSTYGNWILLRHNFNGMSFFTFYAHLRSISVEEGETVGKGEEIAVQGGNPQVDENPGQSTGSHLHFEVRLTPEKTSAIDPALLLNP